MSSRTELWNTQNMSCVRSRRLLKHKTPPSCGGLAAWASAIDDVAPLRAIVHAQLRALNHGPAPKGGHGPGGGPANASCPASCPSPVAAVLGHWGGTRGGRGRCVWGGIARPARTGRRRRRGGRRGRRGLVWFAGGLCSIVRTDRSSTSSFRSGSCAHAHRTAQVNTLLHSFRSWVSLAEQSLNVYLSKDVQKDGTRT